MALRVCDPAVCVCVCETLFTKGIRFYACFFVSFFFTQGAQGLVIQLGPTKLCMMQPGKRTCRSVPGCCKCSWIDQHRDKAEQLEPTTSLRGCLQVCSSTGILSKGRA